MGGNKVYEYVTNQIIEMLEGGTIPWRKPWKVAWPQNAITKKIYRGLNPFILNSVASNKGYDSPYWATFRQVKQMGGHVKAGEKSTMITFWKMREFPTDEKDDDGKPITKRIPMLRYYNVFNLSQCEFPDDAKPPTWEGNGFNPIEKAEEILGGMPDDMPDVFHGGDRACYKPRKDTIHMPPQDSFSTPHEYYSTRFHEEGHATGHENRVGRFKSTDVSQFIFASESYSKEELVAEFTAAFLCGISGIEAKTIENSAAYIASWMEKLKEDDKLVVHAAAAAQKAVDFILNDGAGEDN